MTCAVAVALAPATLLAQQPPPTQQPPTQPPAQQQPAQPTAPKEPRVTFKGDVGSLLFTIKGDQSATFEELITKVKDALTNSEDPVKKQQAGSFKVYKAAEPAAGGNVLYILLADPAVKGAEYDPIMIMVDALGKDYATPENQAMMKRYAEVFANVNLLNLTAVAK
jgi:hypothetical protein